MLFKIHLARFCWENAQSGGEQALGASPVAQSNGEKTCELLPSESSSRKLAFKPRLVRF